MTKQELLQRVIETITQEKERAKKSFARIREIAIDAPGAMQSQSDTTKWQMSLLAEEIQRSINEKSFAIRILQNMMYSDFLSDNGLIRVGSIVEVLSEYGEQEIYFILLIGGGIEIVDNEKRILVVTPLAPLAAALLGKRKDQLVKLQIDSQKRELRIMNVQ